jgi:Flp pilus assembly pilin Flp
MWRRFWRDDAGTLLTSEYLILGTLLTLGIVVGVSATRTTLVSEYEDYAAAIMGLWVGGLEDTNQVVFDGNEEGTYTIVP